MLFPESMRGLSQSVQRLHSIRSASYRCLNMNARRLHVAVFTSIPTLILPSSPLRAAAMIEPRFVCALAPIVGYWSAALLAHCCSGRSRLAWPASAPSRTAVLTRVLANQTLRAFIQLACWDDDALAATFKANEPLFQTWRPVGSALTRLAAAWYVFRHTG